MKEPNSILRDGTPIITNTDVKPIKQAGVLVKDKYIQTRKPGAPGTILGCVPGHGGDIYWVEHEEGNIAVYGWPEFELEPNWAKVNKIMEE